MSAPPFEIATILKDERWQEAIGRALEPVIERAALAALVGSQRPLAGPAELSIVLTNDAEQAALNAQWRGKESSTNVLSFPGIGPEDEAEGLIGDITLAYETVVREAGEQAITLEAHLTHLVVHGFLHILGYDHEDDEEALAMEALETKILMALGIADPYGA